MTSAAARDVELCGIRGGTRLRTAHDPKTARTHVGRRKHAPEPRHESCPRLPEILVGHPDDADVGGAHAVLSPLLIPCHLRWRLAAPRIGVLLQPVELH